MQDSIFARQVIQFLPFTIHNFHIHLLHPRISHFAFVISELFCFNRKFTVNKLKYIGIRKQAHPKISSDFPR